MSSDRLNRKVFVWADCISISNKCVKNWNFNIKKTLSELNVGYYNITKMTKNLQYHQNDKESTISPK
jgi:hypothetical protein